MNKFSARTFEGATSRKGDLEDVSPYVSAKELALRWRCARSSVDRIVRRAGLRRICLGSGCRGMVRFLREEVTRYENSRLV
jgi:hypothetical protein